MKAVLGRVYGQLSGWNQALYDKGLRKPIRLSRPVISIGNLSVGGTGKTPITAFCLDLLRSKGHHPGLVVRSYKASLDRPSRVDLSAGGAELFGDEAVWYAGKFPEVPVWAGPSKSRSAEAMLEQDPKIDVVLVDDGFQHRRLFRDLNLLLLDSEEPLSAYRPFPEGRLREPLSGHLRADAYLWTKWEKGRTPVSLPLNEEKPQFHFSSNLAASVPREKCVVVSGIARPQNFLRLLERGGLPAERLILEFPDHHDYRIQDVLRIQETAKVNGCAKVLTTEKDAVKLSRLWNGSDIKLLALPLEVHLEESVESFYEFLSRPLRSRS